MTLAERFEQFENDSHEFEKVEPKTSQCPDIHALMLLERLLPLPNGHDMVSGAEHDEITLNVDLEKLEEVITDDQILELRRCGVFCYGECHCLAMFV